MNEIVLQQPAPPKIQPRILRNKLALEKYLADNKIVSQWPAVELQKDSFRIEGLPRGAYNPSIIFWRGVFVMTYRYHETTLKTKLGIAELDSNFKIVSNADLNFDEEEGLSLEDSRLFIWKGELWSSFVVSTWPNYPSSQVKIAKLYKPDRWRYSDKEQYWLPDRQTMEKNHLPIIYDDVFNIVYKANQPQEGDYANLAQIVYSPQEKREMKTPALRWAFGEVRGGTVPVPYKGRLLSFFHSALWNEMPPVTHRYYVGAVLRKAVPPFNMIEISKRPILRGSEVGGDSGMFHFKPNVVIPYGVIEQSDGWILSVGQNDSACLMVRIKPEDLNL